MRNRLEVARELLREDGSIWINIDDDESHYLKVFCDEVFGRENFVANIIWQKKYTISNDAKYFSDNHDHIIVIAKEKDMFVVNGIERKKEQNARYKNPDNDPNGAWMTQPLHAKSGNDNSFSYKFQNGVTWESPRGTFPRYSKESLAKFESETRLWFGKDGKAVPRLKKYLKDMGSVRPATIWSHQEAGNNDEANREVKQVVDNYNFSTPKPERLIQRILAIGSAENDLVLDFYSGSGTTCAVAHKTGRRYIGIEQMDYIHDVTCERLKKVIVGEQGGISKSVNWQGGGSFIYCELRQHNANIIDKIEQARTSKTLIALWREMENTDFISYKIKPKSINENIHEFEALSMEEQKQFLIAVLDKNQLYVNYSEIDDADYQISDDDKKLNKKFYGDS